MKIAAFSTDWTAEPVPDPNRKPGEPVKDQRKLLSFGGTYYYRMAMPAMELVKHGYESILTWQLDVAPDGHIKTMDPQGEWHSPDVVWLQRHMGIDFDKVILRARAAGQVVINDVDDDFWNLGPTNLAYHTTDPRKSPKFNRDHYLKNIRASSAVTVSTEALRRQLARPDGPPVFVVRNAIDIQRWEPKDPTSDGAIGWVGGIQWRAHDLHVLKPVLSEFLEDYGLPFYHGGDSQVPGVPKAWDQLGIDPRVTRCMAAPLCHISKYPGLWHPINLALVPLEICRFNKAKSYLKALEASACGVPYIVSAGFPEQQILIDEGGAGRVARNDKPSTWRRHLEELLDPEVRALEGKQNRVVAELHDIALRWVDWDEVFKQVTP